MFVATRTCRSHRWDAAAAYGILSPPQETPPITPLRELAFDVRCLCFDDASACLWDVAFGTLLTAPMNQCRPCFDATFNSASTLDADSASTAQAALDLTPPPSSPLLPSPTITPGDPARHRL